MIDSNELFKALAGPDIPEKPSITVHLERGSKEDMVWLSQCVDPAFDMRLLAEGLATAVVIAAKYQDMAPQKLLEEVVHNLTEQVKWHGTIKRKE